VHEHKFFPLIISLEELASFRASPPCNCTVETGPTVREWTVGFTGVAGSAFEGEAFRLRVIFPSNYPNKPPQIFFLRPAPKHQHVYTNGDICLNLLGPDWRPNLTAEALIISIISMISSATKKSIPPDNALRE
jgi:ubiquitin-conjugating enzyme E2 W